MPTKTWLTRKTVLELQTGIKFTFRYVKPYTGWVIFTIFIKIIGAFAELFIPYVLEYMLDTAAPAKDISGLVKGGIIMSILILLMFALNIISNTLASNTARKAVYVVRNDLFNKSINLSGKTFDEFGLPSITSRMTSDSYNIQDFVRMFQSFGVRAPLMLIGGVIVSFIMDKGLGLILLIIAPITVAALIFISFKGIPLYDKVQRSLDDITLVMRENITGIRVVKALSKEDYEKTRFDGSNEVMTKRDRKAGTVMGLPTPVMTLFLNIGLVLCVYVGSVRVNAGFTEPGVILAFLTYFNMILNGAMGLSRVLLMMSKCIASANRIAEVIDKPEELLKISDDAAAHTDSNAKIIFDNVSFQYGEVSKKGGSAAFAGEDRQKSLVNINFSIPAGGTLGIIGPTGCGKTTIINLMMRFYDADSGHIFIDGRDVRSYGLQELRSKFGTIFQNDMIFADTIEENIKFGRNVSDEKMRAAAADGLASEFIEEYEDGYQHMASPHGANFSGGQKQRILISRALAGDSEILIMDDSSSALDYKTDAMLRKAIHNNYNCTTIIIAQRVSSIMSLDRIIVMDEGRIIGAGTHEQLMQNCPEYLDIYKIQMGEDA